MPRRNFSSTPEERRAPFAGARLLYYTQSRRAVEELMPRVPYVVVSVTTPEKRQADIPAYPLLRGILRLQFHDATACGDGRILYCRKQARRVMQFLTSQTEQVGVIVTHCEAGVSRSAAINLALAQWVGEEGAEDHYYGVYRPNPHVHITQIMEARLHSLPAQLRNSS